MGVFSFGAKKLYYSKKDVKTRLKKGFTDKRQKDIEEGYPNLKGQKKENADSVYAGGRQQNKAYSHDTGIKKIDKVLKKRKDSGRKPRGYIKNKLEKGEKSRFKNGKFVQIKTKLGRNRPTKLY
jgi:hypothetical protein|tara:strand:+ start:628 stop:999 length:372 start_codon:yes stop_codon:yes gene_type:complete